MPLCGGLRLVLIVSGPDRDEQGKHSIILNKKHYRKLFFIANLDVLYVMMLDSRGLQVQGKHLHGLRVHGP